VFCSQCGGRLSLTAYFCEECGAPRDHKLPSASAQSGPPTTTASAHGASAVGLKSPPSPGSSAIRFNPSINVNVASQGPAAVAPAAQAYTAVTVADGGGVHPIMTALWFAFLVLWVAAIGVTTGWTSFSGLLIGGLMWLALFQHVPPLVTSRPRHRIRAGNIATIPAQRDEAAQGALLVRAVLVLAGIPVAAMWILVTDTFRQHSYYTDPNTPEGTALVGAALLVSFLLFDYVWVALAKRLR